MTDNSTCGERDGVIMETRVGRMLLVVSERTAQLSARPSPDCGLRYYYRLQWWKE